jgi:ion channel POLLUX/CASTOR
MSTTGRQLRQRTTKAISQGSARRPLKVSGVGRLRYRFDNTMSRGASALVAWLAILTLALGIVFAVFTRITGIHRGTNFINEAWSALMHSLDPGTVAGDSGNWPFRITMLILTIAGLFIVSALIGVISAGIDAKLADLRRGRSIVVEKDHTVILGWSSADFTILRELSIANESRRKPAIVILADMDKPEMEDELREKVGNTRGTRVVCRSGSPIDPTDLALTSHTSARSIIVLSPDSSDPDAEVIKTLLALSHDGGDAPIVAEIADQSNLEVARMVGADRAVILDKLDTIARLIVQTSRQSGASAVFTELFDFDGSEIYFLDSYDLPGECTYGQAQLAFEEAILIGLLHENGSAELNPTPATPIAGRTLVLVAEDDSAIEAPQLGRASADASAIANIASRPSEVAKIVVIGWNAGAPTILRELDNYAPSGSDLTILSQFGEPELPTLKNLNGRIEKVNTTDRSALESYVAGADQIIVLCYSDHLEEQQADARTLVTLLHVRQILGDDSATAVVSEMLDDHNRPLAQVARVDDVIISDELLSLMLSQLSENAGLAPVFADLLDAEGSEIYLRPAVEYISKATTFATVVAAATERGETALGYRFADEIAVNVPKSRAVPAEDSDRVIVIARQ